MSRFKEFNIDELMYIGASLKAIIIGLPSSEMKTTMENLRTEAEQELINQLNKKSNERNTKQSSGKNVAK